MPAAAQTLAPVETPLPLNGESVAVLPEGGLWIESARTLVVSDLHFEKGSWFARRGQMLPPYDTRATFARLAALIERCSPQTIVSLGDSFHDGDGPARMEEDVRTALSALTRAYDWVWILGNHDPELPADLGGQRLEELRIGALTLRHEPRRGAAPGEIAGHLHPCAKVWGRGLSVRRRCFATDGARLVMPAFGAYAGGLNVRDKAFGALFPGDLIAFVMSNNRILPAGGARLLPDL